jgi:hypothetical protein
MRTFRAWEFGVVVVAVVVVDRCGDGKGTRRTVDAFRKASTART